MARIKLGPRRNNLLPFKWQQPRKPLQQAGFVPYFQPLVDLRTGQLNGFEVLARWHHSEAGVLLPDTFVHRAEQEGWISDLTKLLLQQALGSVVSLGPPIGLSINVTPLQLQQRHLAREIELEAEKASFPLPCLTIEITETAFLEDRDRALGVARDLKAMGCRLSLDDFGTGYSSLLHLQSLPFDEIKVDRSFVSSMSCRRESRKIVAAVVGLGQSLGISTVAEGVESQEQADMLVWLGCNVGQGWLFGRPVPAEQLPAMLEQRTSAALVSNTGYNFAEACSTNPAERLAQLQAVYDGAPVGLAFLDKNLRYRNLNQRMADINGLPVEQHLGREVAEIVPEVYPQVLPFLKRALSGETIRDVEITVRDAPLAPRSPRRPARVGKERTRWLSYQPVRDEAGEVIGVSVAVIDLTEYKRLHLANRSRESLTSAADFIFGLPGVRSL